MLRPNFVGQRRVAAIVAPLALILSMGISHQAFAACDQASPITGTVPDVNCDGNDDTLEIEGGGVVTNNVNMGDGTNEVTHEGEIGNDLIGGAGNDTFTIDGGSVGGNVNAGNGNNEVSIDDGEVGGNVVTGTGNDTVTIEETEVGGNVTTGAGDDTVNLDEEAEIGGNVNTDDGEDTVTIDGGEVAGNVNTGADNDTVTVESGEVTGTINTDDGIDKVTINGGEVGGVEMGAGGPDLTTGNYDNFIMHGGEIGFVHTDSGSDRLELFGGEINGEILTGDGDDRVDINGVPGNELDLNGTLLNTGGGIDQVRFRGANNLEDEEENVEINPDLVFNGGGDYDKFQVEDESEVILGNEILNFEYLLVEEESVLVLTGEEYKFGDAAPIVSGDPPMGIEIDGGSQVWFTGAEELEATHIEIGAANGEAKPLKVSNQYAAFDPGGMLMFGVRPAEGGDDDDDGSDDESGPVNTRVEIGPDTVDNAGTMGMLNGIAGDRVEFVGGGYESDANTGKFVIDTKLGGSNSLTDRFDFDPAEDVDGLTTIYVNNAGGTGAFTGHGATDGIVIVTGPAGFGPTGSFQLGINLTGRREVLAGAFSYQLRTFGGNVVLQSDVLDQVPAYTVASSASQRFASTGLGTLYKRLGEVRLGHANDQALAGGGSIWARGLYGDYDIDPQQGYGFSQKTDGVFMGVDSGVVANEGGGRWLFGLFGGYGNSDVDVTATIWGQNTASKLDLNGWSVGGYGTYWENGRPGTGYYFDGVIKADILDYDMTSVARSTSASTDGYAGTVSGETGYGFAFGGNLTLQPQAQLSYTSVSITNYTDSYGIKVGNGAAESLIGRASLQLQGNYGSGNSGWFAPYVIASVLSDFLGGNETVVGGTPFQNDMGLTWFEAGGGLTAELSNSVSIYGSAEYSVGDVEGWGGTGGVKARW